jgi:hypothetical protein
MKIDDILTNAGLATGLGAKRNAAHPEVTKLLNTHKANKLLGCKSLAQDERELANFIIKKLVANPQYVPSETLLQAILAINDKVANDSPLRGMIRTA